jgi:hypothetical protein
LSKSGSTKTITMKICNHEGCKYNQFGGGYCKYHQCDRTDKNVSPRSKNNDSTRKIWIAQQKPIRKISRKGKQRREQKAKLSEKDKLFWAAIWEEREHVDFETGEPIYGEYRTLYFHHVLPKHPGPVGYPQFRYKKWNIVIVSWDTHTKAENNIDLVPKIKAYRDKLLKNKVK